MTTPTSRSVSMTFPDYILNPVIDAHPPLVGVHALIVRAKTMKISRWPKRILTALAFCGLFVASAFVEMVLRAAKTESIPVDSTLAPDVTITAARMPDFLWLGTAWWINYQSPVSFDLDIGGGRAAQVPAGTHKIYSNHDHSNLDEYGLSLSTDFPKTIVAQQTKP